MGKTSLRYFRVFPFSIYGLFLNKEFHASILCPTFFRIVRSHGFVLASPDSSHAVRGNALIDEPVLYRLCPFQRKCLIEFLASHIVRMPGDYYHHIGIRDERVVSSPQYSLGIFRECRFIKLKIDTSQNNGLAFFKNDNRCLLYTSPSPRD